MKDRTPSLREVEAAIKRAESLLPKLKEQARWLWSLGYGGSGSGEAKRYALGDVSDPTAGSATSRPQATIRAEQRTAGNQVLDAVTRLTAALAACERAYKAADHGTPEEPSPGPRTVTKAELAEAERAKARREARNAGWGAA